MGQDPTTSREEGGLLQVDPLMMSADPTTTGSSVQVCHGAMVDYEHLSDLRSVFFV